MSELDEEEAARLLQTGEAVDWRGWIGRNKWPPQYDAARTFHDLVHMDLERFVETTVRGDNSVVFRPMCRYSNVAPAVVLPPAFLNCDVRWWAPRLAKKKRDQVTTALALCVHGERLGGGGARQMGRLPLDLVDLLAETSMLTPEDTTFWDGEGLFASIMRVFSWGEPLEFDCFYAKTAACLVDRHYRSPAYVRDIRLVAQQSDCSLVEATRALVKHDFDIVNAIMDLTM
jgi:hypothetical protein